LTKYKSYDVLNESFIEDVKSLVKEEFFNHYYLINIIGEVFNRRAQFNDAFTFTSSENSWIIGFSAFGEFLLYGKNWNDEQVDLVSKKIKQSNLENGFHLAGTFALLQELKSKILIKTEIFKERIFYSCDTLVKSQDKTNANVGSGEMKYHTEITQMVCDYFEHEYKGQNPKEFSQMLPQTLNQIQNGTIWQITTPEGIVGFCSIIETSVGLPIIGSFFIKEMQRNQGLGKMLLEEVTQNLLNDFEEVWLMSDKSDIPSNKIFVKLGFKPVYETGDYIVLK